MVRLLLAVLLLASAACSPYKVQSAFNPVEYDKYRGDGTGKVLGQGFLRQNGGGVVTCAGRDVFAFPATAYMREINAASRGGALLGPFDSGASTVVDSVAKRGICDAQGNFEIDDLRAGNWIIVTRVLWTVGYSSQGGQVDTEVTLADGETKKVILTR
jgi:hypothetical protein